MTAADTGTGTGPGIIFTGSDIGIGIMGLLPAFRMLISVFLISLLDADVDTAFLLSRLVFLIPVCSSPIVSKIDLKSPL